MESNRQIQDLIALTDLPGILPVRRNKRVSLATIYRWANRGVRGRRLIVVSIGGVKYASPQAIADFLGTSTHGNERPSTAIIEAALRAKKLK